MISEEKIKLMSKVALYEEKDGKEDLNISRFHMRQYIQLESIRAFIVNTIAYFFVMAVGAVLFIDKLQIFTRNHGQKKYIFIVFLIYLVFILIQVTYARLHARTKYEEAMPRFRGYKKNLTKLYYMYEIKEKPEEIDPDTLKETLEEELDEEFDTKNIDI